MPNIKSQEKRMRRSRREREKNKSLRSASKTAMKRFAAACRAGDLDSARDLYSAAAGALDKAAAKGALHKNKAANCKSRMAREMKNLSG